MLRTTEALIQRGIGPDQIRDMVKRGELIRVRRGVYADLPVDGDHKAEHLRLAQAVALGLGDNKVFSHQTAGILHGLPVWRVKLSRVTATRNAKSGGRKQKDLQIRAAALPETDVTQIDGLPVTTMARTAADLARDLPLMWGLPVLDAALRKGVTAEELTAQVESAKRWPGVRMLRAAVEMADALAESAGESASRVVLRDLGIPAPELQQDILHSRTGRFIARPDFRWPKLRIVGEFDGKVKYSCGVEDGTLDTIVMAEKQREHELRADGWKMMRWVWAELYKPEAILGQWRVALREAA